MTQGQGVSLQLATDQGFMARALEEARGAIAFEEVPIGAVIVHRGEIIAAAGNRTRTFHDPTAHAEVLAIRAACQALEAQRIPECDLYVTLEPCTLCAAAIAFARIRRLVVGAADPKGGAVVSGIRFFDQPTCHHKKIDLVTGVEEEACATILKEFFQKKRDMSGS